MTCWDPCLGHKWTLVPSFRYSLCILEISRQCRRHLEVPTIQTRSLISQDAIGLLYKVQQSFLSQLLAKFCKSRLHIWFWLSDVPYGVVSLSVFVSCYENIQHLHNNPLGPSVVMGWLWYYIFLLRTAMGCVFYMPGLILHLILSPIRLFETLSTVVATFIYLQTLICLRIKKCLM